MRMPLLSYFLVVGAVLFGGLILVSSQLAIEAAAGITKDRRSTAVQSPGLCIRPTSY
jgi:hypothetical protein